VVEEVNQYWQAVGIQPTDEATADEVVKRLAIGLGVELSSAAINDPEQLQAELSQPQIAQAVAWSWLQQVSEGGIARVQTESSELLNQELADSFRSKPGFDRVLTNLINGNSPNSSAFLDAVSAGKQDEQAMIRRLAALTMNVDLRCTQCHDSYMDKNDRQEDFWAFAALIGRGMQRDENGKWAVNKSPSNQSFFYELPDHRQKFVEPSVAEAWCKSDRPITTVDHWTEQLVGSTELARGVINSLWQLVHGRPLSGRVVDPISAPHNESLDRLEDHLVQDMIRSDFDIARSLSLIIASPTTRRSVPTVLQPENALVASEADRRAAMNQVDAFAASTPIAKPLSSRERFAQVKRAIGLTLDPNGESFVGQIGETVDGPMHHQSTTKTLSAELPDRAEQFPVQWLGAIKDEKSRIEHLGYLTGMTKVPDSVFTADEEMRKAEVSEALRLHRVWWLIQP
jgi:hypothetical protein